MKTKTARTAKKHNKIPVCEVEIYTVEEFFKLGSNKPRKAKPVGWASNPDDFGPMIVDRKTFEKLCGGKMD